MSYHDRGGLGSLAIIGFMTASRRLRKAGGILGVILFVLGVALFIAFEAEPPPRYFVLVGYIATIVGGALIFFWFVASVLSWLTRIAKEDLSETN